VKPITEPHNDCLERRTDHGKDQSIHNPYVTLLQNGQGLAQGTRL
jgi:hypothetical protein